MRRLSKKWSAVKTSEGSPTEGLPFLLTLPRPLNYLLLLRTGVVLTFASPPSPLSFFGEGELNLVIKSRITN